MAIYRGMKITIMGLGLNGGGVESARYLALNGAECTITDMQDEKTLMQSIEQLESLSSPHPPFRYVLGRHEMEDFTGADMVVKNPAVRPDSPFLAASRHIETDISLFLSALQLRKIPVRLIAITGSKGKSITASAVHWVLSRARTADSCKNYGLHSDSAGFGRAFLGGNIAVSPLSFLDKLGAEDDVVLELSSWQLGDLKGRGLLKPRLAIITSIMPDHLDKYDSMETYVNDKRVIYKDQDKNDATVASTDDPWGVSFLSETPGRPLPYSVKPFPKTATAARAWLDPPGEGMAETNSGIAAAVPSVLLVPGRHNKKNCLAAALALLDLGFPASFIHDSLGSFPGIEHRLEFFHERESIRFYNDTTATIPEAAAAAIDAFTEVSAEDAKKNTSTQAKNLVVVAGGTDKNLDFSPLVAAIKAHKNAVELILLSGTGSDKLIPLLKKEGISFNGPLNTINDAAKKAIELGRKASPSTVVLSPGCTSFGMFKNEFDRGNKWKEAILGIT